MMPRIIFFAFTSNAAASQFRHFARLTGTELSEISLK